MSCERCKFNSFGTCMNSNSVFLTELVTSIQNQTCSKFEEKEVVFKFDEPIDIKCKELFKVATIVDDVFIVNDFVDALKDTYDVYALKKEGMWEIYTTLKGDLDEEKKTES